MLSVIISIFFVLFCFDFASNPDYKFDMCSYEPAKSSESHFEQQKGELLWGYVLCTEIHKCVLDATRI